MTKRKYKHRNYDYFKEGNYLQEYCMANMVQDKRAPVGSHYYGKRFYTPEQVHCGSLKEKGKLSLFDSSNPSQGQNLNMWKDWLTNKSGDIYMLVMWNENIPTRYEAYDRLEEFFGKVKTKTQSRPQWKRYRNKTVKEAKKEGNFEQMQQHFADEEAKCMSQRRAIEKEVIQNLRETGAFFKSMGKMPCQVVRNDDGSFRRKSMTSANYLKGMLLNADDPRYMCRTDIRNAGWDIKEGAKPEQFEFLVTKDAKRHLVTFKLYNAKDIEGIPPHVPEPTLSTEEVTDRIKTMLKDNGVEMPDEALFKDPLEGMKALRKLAAENTWKDAKVPAQRFLEREYAMTKLLQYAGATKPYKIKDCPIITEYLEHDMTSRVLYKSTYRGDTAAQAINGAYSEAELKRVAERTREIEAMMAEPLRQLEITMKEDYRMNDTLIPKGAHFQGDKAYDMLYQIIQEDRRLFENIDNPDYRKPVSFQVQFQDWKQDISLQQGLLQTGNKGTVTESLQYAAMRPLRENAFDEVARDNAIEERVKLKLFNGDDDFKEAYQESPETIKEAEARLLVQEYQKADLDLAQKSAPLLQSECRYLGSHPAYRKIEDRVDTYLYHVPANEEVNNEIDVRKKYGELALDVKRPDFYSSKEDGLVIELKHSLVADYNGNFMAPGLEEEPLMVKPFLKEIEQRNVQEFEQKFAVSLETDEGKETYKGDDARQFLYALMQDDQEMWTHEQSGMKPVEYSGWRKLNVSYDDVPIIKDREYYDGQLKIGNARFAKELMTSDENNLDAKGKAALKELNKGLRVLEKYTDNQEQHEAALEFDKPKKEEITEVLSRGFEPEGMEANRPKVGRKVSQVMPWYEAKAVVNYCHTNKEKTDYMVAELAKKYKADTIQRWIGSYLPKYKGYVKESLERPEIKQALENQPKRGKTVVQAKSQTNGRGQ